MIKGGEEEVEEGCIYTRETFRLEKVRRES
jgi:hypothetical protein